MRWRSASRIVVVLLACAVTAGGGCAPAEGPVRIAVFGTVTSEAGDPVSGMISFLPEAGTDGPAATASLNDGIFKFDTRNGPVAGKYRVLVVKQLADRQFKGAPARTGDDGPSTGALQDDQPARDEEWSFNAAVSPEDVEFDFQVHDAAAAGDSG